MPSDSLRAPRSPGATLERPARMLRRLAALKLQGILPDEDLDAEKPGVEL